MLLLCMVLTGCDEWRETYEKDKDLPYGLDLLPEVLQAGFAEAEYTTLPRRGVRDGALDSAGRGDLYVAASGGLSFSARESEALAAFVERGGTAFLMAGVFSNRLAYQFAADSCAYYRSLSGYAAVDSSGHLVSARGDTAFWPILTYELDTESIFPSSAQRTLECYPQARDVLRWHPRIADDEATEAHTWVLDLPKGEGHLYWLSVPMAFTNVYAVDSLGQLTIELILGTLPQNTSRVLYDVKRESSEAQVHQENTIQTDFNARPQSETLLAQVLERPPLAAAWYLLLLGFLVFVVVGAKRRQRLVPLVHARRNTTHEHLGSIARLYLARPDNPLMARKQLRLFESYCNRRFGLKPLEVAEHAERLRQLQGVSPRDVDTILRFHRTADRQDRMSNESFVQLVHILQQFYRQVGRSYE